jgi:hypothetical protein
MALASVNNAPSDWGSAGVKSADLAEVSALCHRFPGDSLTHRIVDLKIQSNPPRFRISQGVSPMDAHESTAIPPSHPDPARPDGSAALSLDTVGKETDSSGAGRAWAIAAGMIAAVACWLLIESTLDRFKPKGTPTRNLGLTFLIPGAQERAEASVRQAALAMGLTGASAGFALGLAGGLARRSGRSAALAAITGAILAAAAGAGTGWGAVPLATRIHDRDRGSTSAEMIASLVAHGLPWAAIGAMSGLAFGIGRGGWHAAGRGLLGGLLGALAGALLYEIIGATAFSGSKINDLVAVTWDIRLLASFLATISIGGGIAALAPEQPRTATSPSRWT